ncbi:hypothetical protein NST74_24235 [Paenibacillus sp. FSL F4-0125]|uniref:hypothetical protein n=1 Tax=Paenibacillus sp. FSL F4-0125 TaxID=2954730 RepID=UPI0030F96048
MTIISYLLSPNFLMIYGALIVTVVSLYQYYERFKVHFIFRQPNHVLAIQYAMADPKLVNKMITRYGKKLSERHNTIISQINFH